jgi:integrase
VGGAGDRPGTPSQRTVVMIHNVLHHALRRALQLGLVTRNSANAVIKPKLKRIEMKVLDEIQVRSLLMSAKGSHMEALLRLAVTIGMREGELIGLKWADLDSAGRKIHIQRQIQRIKRQGLAFFSPKTAKSRRLVAIGAATIEKLREQLDRQQLERMFAGTKWVENDLIFANRIGKPMEPANLLKLFKELLVKANLPDIRIHDLRHTAATFMLLQEVHPSIVQERLGHSDISLTLNTYSHVLPSMQESAAEKMDELVTLTEVGKELQKKKVTR